MLNEARRDSYHKSGVDVACAKPVCRKTVQAYHSALMQDRRLVLRAGKDKDRHRLMAEGSQRSMLTNAAGILAVTTVVGDSANSENDVPNRFKFRPKNAGEGLLLSRDIMAEALGVSVENIHFTPRALLYNTDDMACMWSQENGFQVLSDEKGLVLREAIDDVSNKQYNTYQKAKDDSQPISGVKGRSTNTFAGDGIICPIFLQIPGFTDEEMSPDLTPGGVIFMEVESLSPVSRDCIKKHPNYTFLTLQAQCAAASHSSNSTGYVALIRKGQGNETQMFEEYAKTVLEPSIDAARSRLGVDPETSMGRAVTTTDGGGTQLKSITSKKSLERKDQRNETAAKLSKQTSTVFQPCDQATSHRDQRQSSKKLSKEPVTNLACLRAIHSGLQGLTDTGRIKIDSKKFREICGMVARIASAVAIANTEKKVIDGFIGPGWTDRQTGQGPDIFAMFGSYKKKWTPEQRAKWLKDLPKLVKTMLKYGYVPEEVFDELEYPLDIDVDGAQVPLTAHMTSQTQRQRFLVLTNKDLRGSLCG